MVRFALRLLAMAGLFFVMPRVVSGVRIERFGTALVAALVFSALNALVGGLLRFLLIIGTLGLAFFALNFLANTVLLFATDKLLDDFEIKDVRSLFLSSAILTVGNGAIHLLLR